MPMHAWVYRVARGQVRELPLVEGSPLEIVTSSQIGKCM